MRTPLVRFVKRSKKSFCSQCDLYGSRRVELELLRSMVEKLERLSGTNTPPSETDRIDMLEMYSLLLLLEVSQPSQASSKEGKDSVDWARLLPLLLAVGVVLGVILAELLGLDMRRIL